MGRCWKCDTELRLVGKQWLCDNCNEPIAYKCWNCGDDFVIKNRETKRNLPECNACGFYYCPKCNSCAEDCPRIEWQKIIGNILAGQYTLDGSLIIANPKEKIKKVAILIGDLKTEKKEHRVCPFYVYASYARGSKGEQGRIKTLLAKMNGIGVKSPLDATKFKEKFDKVIRFAEGEKFTIQETREEGRYGQEERDACNLGICMRELVGELVTNKKGKKGIVYTKIKSDAKCMYLREDNYITKRCPHCNKDYNNPQLQYYQPNIDFCPNCIYKKGNKKNTHYPLVIKETNTFTCNCPWNNFITIEKNEENEDGEEGE